MAPKIIKTEMPFPVFSREADIDYLLARFVHFLGAGFHGRAGFFGHQACEKYLKALSVQQNGTYAEVHNLGLLADICAPHHSFLEHPDARVDLEIFDAFDQVGRYGGAAKYDPLSTGKPSMGMQFFPSSDLQIAGAFVWTDEHLQKLDRIVFNIRGRLDFKKVNFDDALASILLGNERSALVALWKGPSPIREVLVRENLYFNQNTLRPSSPDNS